MMVGRGRPQTLHLRVTASPLSHVASLTGMRNSGGPKKNNNKNPVKLIVYLFEFLFQMQGKICSLAEATTCTYLHR